MEMIKLFPISDICSEPFKRYEVSFLNDKIPFDLVKRADLSKEGIEQNQDYMNAVKY